MAVRRNKVDHEREAGRVVGVSLGEAVKIYAGRVGLQADERLAVAAAEYLPEWIGMNRNIIQKLQRDEVSLGNGINELQLVAIARALKVPETWLGVDVYESGELRRLQDLLTWVPDASPRDPDQGERDTRCSPVSADQAA